jgi:hypothetical protein
MRAFLHKPVFDSEFDVPDTKSTRLIGRINSRRGYNDVQMHVGQRPPIEFEAWRYRVGFDFCAIRRRV